MSDSGVSADHEVDAAAAVALALRYTEAVNAGDIATLRDLHEPDASIWHNTDGRTQTVEENLALVSRLRAAIPDLAVADARCLATAEGFVQRHMMVGSAPGGALALASCLVVSLSAAGRIQRVEEYVDSAGLAVLRPR